jgi:Tol biopolymer transport system component
LQAGWFVVLMILVVAISMALRAGVSSSLHHHEVDEHAERSAEFAQLAARHRSRGDSKGRGGTVWLTIALAAGTTVFVGAASHQIQVLPSLRALKQFLSQSQPGSPLPPKGGRRDTSPSACTSLFSKQIAYARSPSQQAASEIWVMEDDGSKVEPLIAIPRSGDAMSWSDSDPDWSPDQTHIAFARSLGSLTATAIFVAGSNGQNPIQMSTKPTNASDKSPRWAPDCQRVAFERDFYDSGGVSVTASSIIVLDLTNKTEKTLTYPPSQDGNPTWSPDGTRIAFHRFTRRYPKDEQTARIYSVDSIQGTDLRQLTGGSADDLYPTWSPTGGDIVFAFTRDDSAPDKCQFCVFHLYLTDDKGASPRPLIAPAPASTLGPSVVRDFLPCWSRNGTRIVFQTNRFSPSGSYGLGIVEKEGPNKWSWPTVLRTGLEWDSTSAC